ncbi:unnamed protein product [Ectocarpus sp. CCAP 1310/34]|nr:unnamed protein product [Ectocarpus sp. CCAP 1310/34]
MATWKGGPKPPPRVVAPNKLWHAFKHKNLDVFKFDLDADEDQNYVSASERFLEFQTQLGMVLHHTQLFRKTLEESLQHAVELADDFGRVAAGNGGGRTMEPWAHKAGGQAFFLKAMLEESAVSLRQHLCDELEEKVVRSLREEVANFSTVHTQMLERSNMKMEMLHYSNKVQELKGSQKATDEKKDRNKEKYAQASQALRDQTNQLMSIFAHAEQLRQRLLTQDFPSMITAEKNAFDAFAINLNKAAAETSDGEPRPPRMSDAARAPQRVMPPSDFPTSPNTNAMAEVSLEDTMSPRGGTAPPAYTSPFPVKVEPPPPAAGEDGGAPWSGSNDGGEFGEELKRAHEHQNSKMAAESAAAAGAAAAAAAVGEALAGTGAAGADTPAMTNSSTSGAAGAAGADAADDAENRDPSEAATLAPPPAAAVEKDATAPTESPKPPAEDEATVAGSGPKTESPDDEVEALTASVPATATAPEASAPGEEQAEEVLGVEGGDGAEAEVAEMAELEPGKVRVRALYDYEATQEGDLSFGVGDMIITDGGAFSGDGWVSGTCHGNTGIFPANYTEPW